MENQKKDPLEKLKESLEWMLKPDHLHDDDAYLQPLHCMTAFFVVVTGFKSE